MLTASSRAPMSATGTHHRRSIETRAAIAARTTTLSASGSRKAPERVAPGRQVPGDVDDAVYLGRLPVGAGGARLVDQHVDAATDQPRPPGGGDAVLRLAELAEPVPDQGGIDPAVEAGGVGALLGRVGEE